MPVPIQVSVMNEELTELAYTELGETPEVQKTSLETLRNLLEEEGDLRIPPDDILIKFLRCRKYRAEVAFKTVKNYFRLRRDIPEYFENLKPSTIPFKAVIQDHRLLMCPKEKDPQGRTAVLLRSGSWKREICSMDEFMRCNIVSAECLLLDYETQVLGAVIVVDLEELTIQHLVELTPTFLRRVFAILQDCLPVRIHKLYFINTPVFFEGIFTVLIRPFLSNKLKSRVQVLRTGIAELRDIMPTALTPREFGGTLEDFDFQSQERSLLEKESYFDIITQYGYVKE